MIIIIINIIIIERPSYICADFTINIQDLMSLVDVVSFINNANIKRMIR